MENNHGKNFAVASLVLGIVSIVFWFFGAGAILALALGIVGLVMASKAKNEGFVGGIRTAGFVTSLIGLIGGGIVFLLVIAFGSILTTAAMFCI